MQNLLQLLTIFLTCCNTAGINVNAAELQKVSFDKLKSSIVSLQRLNKEKRILEFVEIHKSRLNNQKTFIFVDYSMPIDKKRFFVFDLRKKKIIYSTFVGHSGYSGEKIPWDTSNTPNTRKTSLGLFKVGVQYYGSFGKSKRLHCLSE